MNLAVGDIVVYGTHGIGKIVARKEQVVLGAKQEVVVVELEEGLTATLPVDRAREQLRPVATKKDLRKVQDTLREDRELSTDPWLARRTATLAKLTAGDPVQLAEIVGDGAQRERIRSAKANKPHQLSPAEREVFVRARKLLAGEIALSLGVEESDADVWIDEQLARPV